MSNSIQRHDAASAEPVWERSLQTIKDRIRSGLPRKEIETFVRFLVFVAVLPPALLAVAFFAVGWKVAAIGPPRSLAQSQQENPKLILEPTGGISQYAAYKLARIKELQPDIIYVGQSRCSQFRSAMFKPYSFYNACLTSWTLDQVREFIERMAAVAKPSIVIVELDYFMFTKEYKAAWTINGTMDFEPDTFVTGINATLSLAEAHPRDLLASLVYPKVVTDLDTGFQLSGFDSIRAKKGFRFDGSYLYPPLYRVGGIDRMEDAVRKFIASVHGGTGLDPRQVEALSRLAATASKVGVKLVGIQLPIYASAVAYLDTDPAYHPYAGVWRAFQSDETRQMLERLGITFFDMVRLPENGEARNFVDPSHPSEIGALHGLLAISSDPRFKSAFPLINPERLRSEYEDATKSDRIFDVYADRF
jgi:hypothetical protein